MASTFPSIGDDVLTLRPLAVEDAAEHLAGEDDELATWLSGGRGTFAGVVAWIERNRSSWQANGHVRNFGVWENETGRLVGNIEANTDWSSLDGLRVGDANLAYGLAPFGRGKGYATRSVLITCSYLSEIGVRRAVIRAVPDNRLSHGVAERAGFVRDGELVTRDGDLMLRWARELKDRESGAQAT